MKANLDNLLRIDLEGSIINVFELTGDESGI